MKAEKCACGKNGIVAMGIIPERIWYCAGCFDIKFKEMMDTYREGLRKVGLYRRG